MSDCTHFLRALAALSIALALIGCAALAPAARAQGLGPPIEATESPIATGPGVQRDPHIDGQIVTYTDQASGSAVRFFGLATGADRQIAQPDPDFALDFLSDVDAGRIVWTRIGSDNGSQIYFQDIERAGPVTELDPQPGSESQRQAAEKGGPTVAWQDFDRSPDGSSDVVAYDLEWGTATRLAADEVLNKNPAVSPDGSIVVWTSCGLDGSNCDIWQATRTGGSWGRPLGNVLLGEV